MLIDTHCHLDEKEYENLEEIINTIFESDVKMLVTSGYDYSSSLAAIELSKKYDNIYASVGFHPSECDVVCQSDYEMLEKWLLEPKVVALGEIGLDYHYDVNSRDKQIEIFKKQLSIAEKLNKPVIIHNREASDDILSILREYRVRGLIHCFVENIEYATEFIKLGFLLGIGGIVTFKNSKLKEVVKDLPLKAIVLETDSPYLTPDPFRGKQNTPANIKYVAQAISNIKNVTYDEVAYTTSASAAALFDFDKDL